MLALGALRLPASCVASSKRCAAPAVSATRRVRIAGHSSPASERLRHRSRCIVSRAAPEEQAAAQKSPASTSDSDGTPARDSLFSGPEPTFTQLELATATSLMEKIAGATIVYGVTTLLGSLTGVDVTAGLHWDGSAAAIGAVAAVPVVLYVLILFAPSYDMGFTPEQLLTIGKTDVEGEQELLQLGGGPADDDAERPPLTKRAVEAGAWFYQMHVLKPWYPPFGWSTVGGLYLASCAAAGAQELLVRGWAGSLLSRWYGTLLAGATDANNPIYWAKVFKLVTPDTARWMAALTLIVLQVLLSQPSASRAAAFTRTSLNRTGRAPPPPGGVAPRGLVVRSVGLSINLDPTAQGGVQPQVESESRMDLEVATCEEVVVYSAYRSVSLAMVGAANLAWAASGNLLGSYAAQVCIDAGVTIMQQLKATSLPEAALWEGVQKAMEEDDDDEEEEEAAREGQEEKGSEGAAVKQEEAAKQEPGAR